MEQATHYTLHIEISPYPEASGLRIKSTNPAGLYLSTRSRESATYWTGHYAADFVMKRKLLPMRPRLALTQLDPTDWEKLILEGGGDLYFSICSPEETHEMLKDATPVVIHPVPKLYANWWQGPTGLMSIVADQEDIDEWIVETIKQDLEAAGHHPK